MATPKLISIFKKLKKGRGKKEKEESTFYFVPSD